MDANVSKYKPLHIDPERVASGSIRGYLYQIWHSLNAWLDLKDDEVIFLEGAEDFDVTKAEETILTQVKAKTGSITLNTADVIKSINYFWMLRNKYPNTKISYRFLSQAEIGKEKKPPIAAKIWGLHIWEQTGRNPENVDLLKTFLAEKKGISEELKTFLSTSSDEDIINKLILPMKWVAGSKDIKYVKAAVENKLILLCEKFRIPASYSANVANALYEHVSSVIILRDNRALNRAQLLQIFDSNTRISIPIYVFDELTQLAYAPEQGSTVFPPTIVSSSIVSETIPKIPEGTMPRGELVDRFKGILTATGILQVIGTDERHYELPIGDN